MLSLLLQFSPSASFYNLEQEHKTQAVGPNSEGLSCSALVGANSLRQFMFDPKMWSEALYGWQA